MTQSLLLRNRGFRMLWVARILSLVGSQAARVALTVLVYRLGGGAAGVSMLLLAFTAPRLLGPLAGAIADRADNRRLMVSCDLAQALLFTGLAWVHWWPGVVLVVLATALFATVYLPAGRGNIPLIADPDNLAGANALLATGSNAALALGPALGGLLLTLSGPDLALQVNAATFLVSALLTLGIPGLRRGIGVPPAVIGGGLRRPLTLFGQAKAGLGDVWRNPVARALAIMLLPSVAFASLGTAALIFLARQEFHASAAGYAWLVSAFSIGMVGAPLALSAIRRRHTPRTLLLCCEAVFSGGTLATGLACGLAAGIGAQFAAGAANGIEGVAVDTLLQQSAPVERLGMVFGTVYAALYAGQLIAYSAATPIILAVGPRTAFTIAAAGVLGAVGLVGWLLPAQFVPLPT